MKDVQLVQIGEWMRASCPWRDMPVNDLADLKMKWRAWWAKLWPADATGEFLQKPGKNGVLLVIMSLAWWGNAVGDDMEWKVAVSQVVEVLRSLQVAAGEKLPAQDSAARKHQKRKQSEGNEDTGNDAPAGCPSRPSK